MLGLLLGLSGQSLELIKESDSRWLDLRLVNSPSLAKSIHNILLVVHNLDGSLLSNVVKTDDTIGDSLGLDQLDPADFSSAVAVGATAGFSVDTFNVHDSELVAGYHTTLVKMETVAPLGLSLVHESLVDGGAVVDDPVGRVLNGSLLLFAQALEVRDIKMGLLGRLLGTMLPDVWAQDLSASSKYDVGARVMGLELFAATLINGDAHLLALEHLKVAFEWPVKVVKDSLTNLLGINDLVSASATLELDSTGIVLLSSGRGVDGRLVEHDDIWLVAIKYVLENINDGGIEVEQVVVVIEYHLGLWKMGGVVKDNSGFLSRALLLLRNLVIQVLWHLSFGDLGNLVSGNTIGLHALNPILDLEDVFSLLEQFVELDNRLLVRESPSVVLDLHDRLETLVFGELTVDTFKVFLVMVEDLQEAFHSKGVPPAVLLHDAECSSQNVTDVTSTADVRGQGTISDGHHHCTGVVKDDVDLFDWLNGFLHSLDIHLDDFGDVFPGLFDIFSFINVKSA